MARNGAVQHDALWRIRLGDSGAHFHPERLAGPEEPASSVSVIIFDCRWQAQGSGDLEATSGTLHDFTPRFGANDCESLSSRNGKNRPNPFSQRRLTKDERSQSLRSELLLGRSRRPVVQKNSRRVNTLSMDSKKARRTTLMGSALAVGSLLAWSLAPAVPALAADPPHLVAFGPTHVIAVGSSTVITGQVQGATGLPVYQFRVGDRIVQRYSTNDHLVLQNLAAGSYTVTVRSLGMGQYRNHLFNRFRSTVLHFTVGSPHLVAKGPANGIAKHGTAFIRARVKQALALPYFHFTINGAVVQKYSHKNYLTLHHLAPGRYVVEVKSLGPAQYRNHQWWTARTKTIVFTVPSAATAQVSQLAIGHVSGLVANGTSKETLTVTATNADHAPVANQAITLVSSNPGVATISPSVVQTNANGVATATLTAGTSAGSSTIEAIANGISTSTAVTTTPEHSEPSLSQIQVTGQQAGTGSTATPAIAATASPLTLSTTLTRRDGQANPGIDLTYTVMPATKGGSLAGLIATQNGKTIAGSEVSGGGLAFVVPTDSQGNASLSLTDSGHPLAATISVAAPYQAYHSATPVNLIWANPGTAVLSPTSADQLFGTAADPAQGAVAVTATVISGPNVPSANQPVTFSLGNGSSADAYLSSSSSGASNDGRSLTISANSHGQATVYADNVPGASFVGTQAATLTASIGGHAVDAIGTSTAQTVDLTWGSAGFPASVTLNSTASSQTTGLPVTISGNLADVVGHPVANATVRLIPVNSSGQPDYNGTDSYLANGHTVAFSAAAPFDSAVTNASGQFSFAVTDSHTGTDTYMVEYQPVNGLPVTFGPTGQLSVAWQPSIQPHTLVVAPSLDALSSASATETVQTDEGTAVSSYVDAYTQDGSPVQLSSTGLSSITYQLTAGAGSELTSINGVTLSSPQSTVTATILADGSVTANGVAVGTVPQGSSVLSFAAQSTKSGSSTIEIHEQSLSAQVTLNSVGTPHQVAFNVSSILPSSVLNNGPVTETLTVEGASGHPIPGAQIAIDGSTLKAAPGSYQNGSSNNAVWVTKVNGSPLTTTVNNQSRSDAFPLVDSATNLASLGYQYPASTSSWHFSQGAMIVTANAQGQITLTLQGQGAGFWGTGNGLPITANNSATRNTSLALVNGTYGLGAWFQGAEIGSALIGNAPNSTNGSAPSAATISPGVATPLTFTFRDNRDQPIEGAKVSLAVQGLSNATWGTSSTASQDTASSTSALPTLVTNAKGEVTVYVVDKVGGDVGTVSATLDGLSLTSGSLRVGS